MNVGANILKYKAGVYNKLSYRFPSMIKYKKFASIIIIRAALV